MHKDITFSLFIFGMIYLIIKIFTKEIIFNFSLIINIVLRVSIFKLSLIFPQYIHFIISLNILKSKFSGNNTSIILVPLLFILYLNSSSEDLINSMKTFDELAKTTL